MNCTIKHVLGCSVLLAGLLARWLVAFALVFQEFLVGFPSFSGCDPPPPGSQSNHPSKGDLVDLSYGLVGVTWPGGLRGGCWLLVERCFVLFSRAFLLVSWYTAHITAIHC